jgi:tetratricopeptide (TPR) repeat protein
VRIGLVSRIDMNINRSVSTVIFLFVFLPLFSVFGYAESGSVLATCVDEAGKPLKGVEVELLSLDNKKIKDKKSNDDGLAEIKDVLNGVYRVVGRKKNYAPAFYEFVKIEASRESVSLKLRPGAEKLLYFEDPAQIQRASKLTIQGIDAFNEERFADAENNLLQAVALNPSSLEALYFLGSCYVQLKKYDEAVETLGKTEKLAGLFAGLPPFPGQINPAQNKAIQDRAKLIIMSMAAFKGRDALEQKNYDEAVAAFTEYLNNFPNDPDAHYQLALALTYAGRFDEAMEIIDKAIQIKPGEKKYPDLKTQISARITNAAIQKAQAALNEGNTLMEGGDASGALVKFQEALNLLEPDRQSIVWRQIGEAQEKLNQPDAAEDAYKKAVEFSPENEAADYLNTLARFYLESKKYEEALDALTDPRSLGSESLEKVLLDLVEKSKNSEPKLAEAALERVIKADPANAEAYFILGRMYYADGKEMDHRTKELLTKYVEIGQDPNNVSQAKDMLVLVDRRSQ